MRLLGAATVVDYHASSAVDHLVVAAHEAGKPIRNALGAVSGPPRCALPSTR